jgi:glyoxylase-like metal-dependent hydrolase (beta-lactamase superfamily II)
MAGRYHNEVEEQEPGLVSLRTQPSFGIGQRAFLVQTPAGNLLWDCISLLDEATVAAVAERGGIDAIAISHPHFYGTCVEWSAAFGDAPVYIHGADAEWVMRPSPRVVLWEGATAEPLPGLTLVHLGGHFDGAAVVHWPAGAGGRGALLTGDTVQVVMDRRFVSFMWSYPNHVPLAPEEVTAITSRLAGYEFDRMYGAFQGRSVLTNAHTALARSAERYLARMGAGVAGREHGQHP